MQPVLLRSIERCLISKVNDPTQYLLPKYRECISIWYMHIQTRSHHMHLLHCSEICLHGLLFILFLRVASTRNGFSARCVSRNPTTLHVARYESTKCFISYTICCLRSAVLQLAQKIMTFFLDRSIVFECISYAFSFFLVKVSITM